MKKNFFEFVQEHDPDILCIQETKMSAPYDDLVAGYQHHINNADKKGYSGTLILSKVEPLSVANGIGIEQHDKEGRVITLEFEEFYLVNVYTVNSQRELARHQYRQGWDLAFLAHLQKLEQSKPVIFCGDLNVAHKEIDLARPKANRKNAGFTDEEREGFSRYIENGFIDSLREFETGPELYSWWSYMGGARARNVGWRIDYVLISQQLRQRLQSAFILADVIGSDHCPVGITLL